MMTRLMSVCVLVVLFIGCQKEAVPPVVEQAHRENVPVQEVQKPEPAEQVEAQKEDPYTAYMVQYKDQARKVKRGEPFRHSDDTPLTQSGEEILFQGIDEYGNIAYQYDNVAQVGSRKVSNPIILPAKVELIDEEPRPQGVITGDTRIGDYLLRILSATNEECWYVVIDRQG